MSRDRVLRDRPPAARKERMTLFCENARTRPERFQNPSDLRPTGLSRLARSTCCQRPFRFPPERRVPVERRSHNGDRPSSKTHQPYREFRRTVNQTVAHSCAPSCAAGNCCSNAVCGAHNAQQGRLDRTLCTDFRAQNAESRQNELKILGGLAICR